jgi:Porin subfamily
VRVSGDTGASGQNLWACTAQFGNGFSGTISLERPATHKAGTVDLSTNGFLVPATALVADNAFTINAGAGFRVPDLIADLRVDQQWGFAGISAALHEGWPATRSATPPSKVLPSCPRPARGPRSRSSTTKASGPQWSAGSATSIHDRLNDPGRRPRRPPAANP